MTEREGSQRPTEEHRRTELGGRSPAGGGRDSEGEKGKRKTRE